jgi:intracellular sulfur oxidation DsrE/DsrF family protein
MQRRSLLAGTAAALGGLFAVKTAAQAAPSMPDKSKVVYHLCDLDKVNFVLGNIQNHFDGVGGPGKVSIALVVHGPALKSFHAASANPDVKGKLAGFSKSLELAACGNTLKAQGVTVKDLLPGFVAVEQGGVVRIAELQSQGYVYLKP